MDTVYLAGGINGLSDDQCNNWRDLATERLNENFHILNPMRRDYRGKETKFVKEIVEGDYDDINKSDILLVNACKPSWGTAMEVHYAKEAGKEIVTVCPDERPSPWLIYHSTIIFKELESAISYIVTLAKEHA